MRRKKSLLFADEAERLAHVRDKKIYQYLIGDNFFEGGFMETYLEEHRYKKLGLQQPIYSFAGKPGRDKDCWFSYHGGVMGDSVGAMADRIVLF